MSKTSYKFQKSERTLMQRLFEAPAIGKMSPMAKIFAYTLLGVWSFFVLFPIYWVVITSFKDMTAVNQGPFYIPFVDFQPTLEAWRVQFSEDPYCTVSAIGRQLWLLVYNSALFFFLLRALRGYFKMSLRNGDILFWIISQRILPPIVVVIPLYVMFQAVGMLDTHLAIILLYAVANMPIVVWLMYDFFRNLPIELEESAQLDGATRLRIFLEIVLPLTRPGLAATTLLTLVLCWNEYLFAVFLATVKVQTMPIMVSAKNTGEKGILWWEMCAVIVVMIIPVIIMAILLTRFISKGVLMGAMKG